MFRNFKTVPRIIFGKGCFEQLDEILASRRSAGHGLMVFIVDDVFKEKDLAERVPCREDDLLLWTSVEHEPKTSTVDDLAKRIEDYTKRLSTRLPDGVIGIGGGSIMDLAKAVSLMLTNPGSSALYQGWDLVKNPGVYHVGVPTLSGTGAEISRTAVLTGPEKKLGINSDFTTFDQIVLDPELIEGAPADQRFYTGMDCYIHCIESLEGTYLNGFSRAFGEKALDLCREVFLDDPPDADERLMMASYMGGMSIAYSQVGVCHALSYGLSYVLGIRHGIGNCMVFNQLQEFYPEGVKEFKSMVKKHNISLPSGVTKDLDSKSLEKMAEVSLGLAPLWENALGPDWSKKITAQRIIELLLQI